MMIGTKMHYYSYVGTYVPLTMDGNIVVDGVLASCYASIDHDLAHFGMIPMRWFPTMAKWIFGEEDTGSQIAVSLAKPLGKWILPDGLFGTNDF